MTNHPNRATTYTVLNRHGDVQGEGETLASAAQILMGYDGHEYEVRQNANPSNGFDLWTSTVSRNSSAYNGLSKSRIYSSHMDEKLAIADIYRQVVRNASWFCNCEAMTDAQYAEMQAQIDD